MRLDNDKRILSELKKYYNEYKMCPTVRELAKICNIRSSSTVHKHLKRWESRGYLRIEKNKHRAITILRI